jgi:cyclopropane fatty-acyl-phospholipid synthase-like methyltransferase
LLLSILYCRLFQEKVKKNDSLSPSSTVLEVGCGFGRITKLLLLDFPNIKEYLAVDLSPHQIENAKEYIRSKKIIKKEGKQSDITPH